MKQQTETITDEDIKLNVTGYYTPEEQPVLYYKDGSGYPGAPAEFEITSVMVEDSEIDIYMLIDESKLEAYENTIINLIQTR